MDGLKGKNVMIFGATRGIGKATAINFAKHGCKVGIFGRKEEPLKEIISELENINSNVQYFLGDVSNDADVNNAITKFVSSTGSLDIAYNNAGFMGEYNDENDLSKELYEKVFSTNILGTILCSKYEIKQMLKQKQGIIVNCASVAGIIGHKGNPVYSASKHAVSGLTKSLALRYAKDNIRVNAVAPGSTETEMLMGLYDNEDQIILRKQGIPMKRFSSPEEISNAVLFLASNRSSFMNGHIMSVDGGVTAGRA